MKDLTSIEIERQTEEMPPWLTLITASMKDRASREAWPDLALRYGTCAREWHLIDADAWSRVEAAVKLSALAVARETVSVDEWAVLPAIDEAMRLLTEGGSDEAWVAARHAAMEAAWAAKYAMESVNWVGARGAMDDAMDAAMVARHAISRSTFAAKAATIIAAEAVVRGAGTGWETTEAATWDRIAGVLLDALEREIAEVVTAAKGQGESMETERLPAAKAAFAEAVAAYEAAEADIEAARDALAEAVAAAEAGWAEVAAAAQAADAAVQAVEAAVAVYAAADAAADAAAALSKASE